jgi:hypothetical protein
VSARGGVLSPATRGDTARVGLPAAARAGLERAWLDILRDRHPEVSWVIAPSSSTAGDASEEAGSSIGAGGVA